VTAIVSFVAMVLVPVLPLGPQLEDARLELPVKVMVRPITWVHPFVVAEFPVNVMSDAGM